MRGNAAARRGCGQRAVGSVTSARFDCSVAVPAGQRRDISVVIAASRARVGFEGAARFQMQSRGRSMCRICRREQSDAKLAATA